VDIQLLEVQKTVSLMFEDRLDVLINCAGKYGKRLTQLFRQYLCRRLVDDIPLGLRLLTGCQPPILVYPHQLLQGYVD
jgi:hypothetical protein